MAGKKSVLDKAMAERPPKSLGRPAVLDNPDIAEVCEEYLIGRAQGKYGSIPWFVREVLRAEFGVTLTPGAIQKAMSSRFPELFHKAVHGGARRGKA